MVSPRSTKDLAKVKVRILKHYCASQSPGELVKAYFWTSPPEFLIQLIWSEKNLKPFLSNKFPGDVGLTSSGTLF